MKGPSKILAAAILALSLLTVWPQPAVAQHYSDWAAPVNLGSPPNTLNTDETCGAEFNPSISRDGLSLYFAGGGPGCQIGLGNFDIYVAHRPTLQSSWGQAVLLDANINSSSAENNPTISPDGRILVFQSNRSGGFGAADLYVSWRDDPNDDFGWHPAVNMGLTINTSAGESGGDFCADEDGIVYLFFSSANVTTSVALQSDGSWGDRRTYPELGQSQGLGIHKDCREIFFVSTRGNTGQTLANDIWTSNRESTLDPWLSPTKLGPSVNTNRNENRPALSWDATQLYFGSNQLNGLGLGDFDLYVSSRVKLTGQGKGVPGQQ